MVICERRAKRLISRDEEILTEILTDCSSVLMEQANEAADGDLVLIGLKCKYR